MIEIIPNWHPVFVHFTVGVLFMAVFLFFAATIWRRGPVHGQLAAAARWNLWLGVLITVGTIAAGFLAFNSVSHSDAAHQPMLAHRNWALGTAMLFVILAGWSLISAARRKETAFSGAGHALFLVLLAVAGTGLAVTGYKGGELVFRYGVGVMQPSGQEGAAGAQAEGSSGHDKDQVHNHGHDNHRH